MRSRRRLNIISLMCLVLLSVAAVRPTAAQAGREADASQQSLKVPEWVTNGEAAFPELRKKGIIERGNADVKKYDSSDDALWDAIQMAQSGIDGRLGYLADGVVDAYAKAVLKKPLPMSEFDLWANRCFMKIEGLLDLNQYTSYEKFLDEKTGIWHILMFKDVWGDNNLQYTALLLEFESVLRELGESKGMKEEEGEILFCVFEAASAWEDSVGINREQNK